MKIEGKGKRETVERFVSRVTEEYAFDTQVQMSEDGCEVIFEIDTNYFDYKLFETATFIDMFIAIYGNGWTLTKPVGKGFVYKVD